MTVQALDLAYRTHVGLVRSTNEDYYSVSADLGLVALADGMGGHRAGDVASRLAVETVMNELRPAQQADTADELESLLRVGQSMEAANLAIFHQAELEPRQSGMGTTLVAAIFRDSHVFYAHVGDSRLYRIRDGRIRCLTRDHSLLQEMVDQGIFLNRREALAAGVRNNVLTRCMGPDSVVDVDVGQALLQPDDLYLFCTDGLNGAVKNKEIARILRDPGRGLEIMADNLIDAALLQGGPDNITLILVRPKL